MKLILSVDALSPQLTGIGRYAWELASRLPRHAAVDYVRFYRSGNWVADPAALLLSPAASRSSVRRRWRWPRPPRWARDALGKWHSRGQVFHGPNYFLPDRADRGVATIHDLSVFKFPETHPTARLKQFERDFNRSMSRAVHLITDSESTRQEVMAFLEWPEQRITAVPLGVDGKFAPRSGPALDLKLSEYGLRQGAYVLCVSTLEPRKKIANLLQAYQCLPKPVRDAAPLVLAGGSGWLSEDLQRAIEHGTSQGWVRYLGFVPEADLPVLYAGAKLFVYPSSYEGFGLPVLEAMASGVPVVSSNCSSLPEVTAGAALLVEPDDVDALAACIVRGLRDVAWRDTACSKGLAVAQAHSWEKCLDRTVRVYADVAAL